MQSDRGNEPVPCSDEMQYQKQQPEGHQGIALYKQG